MPLRCKLSVLPCKGGERFLRGLLEPLGYEVAATRHPLDDYFPDWGDSLCDTVEMSKDATVVELLKDRQFKKIVGSVWMFPSRL